MSNPAERYQWGLRALENTSFATSIREGDRLFPWIEGVHVLALTLVVGSIALVDLRLMGAMSRQRPAGEVAMQLLPLTWGAFAAAAVTGALLFASNATAYGHNGYFLAKMALVGAAGLNMSLFHFLIGRRMHEWHTAATTPRSARLMGALSLTLWVAVVACGRWIGFTINAL